MYYAVGRFLHLQQAKNFYIYNVIKRKSTTPKNQQKTVFGYYFWFNLMTQRKWGSVGPIKMMKPSKYIPYQNIKDQIKEEQNGW